MVCSIAAYALESGIFAGDQTYVGISLAGIAIFAPKAQQDVGWYCLHKAASPFGTVASAAWSSKTGVHHRDLTE